MRVWMNSEETVAFVAIMYTVQRNMAGKYRIEAGM